MKKSKKWLSMILASAMAFGMSAAPVLAADETPAVQDETTGYYGDGSSAITSLSFTKILEVQDENAKITDTDFYFTMTPDTTASGTTDKGYTIHPGKELKTSYQVKDYQNQDVTANATVPVRASDSTKITTKAVSEIPGYNTTADPTKTSVTGLFITGSFDLSNLDFTSADAGIYRYNVAEVNQSTTDNTITYDTRQFVVDLYVNGGEIKYIQAKDNTGNKVPIVFDNSVAYTSLTIKKNIAGTMAKSNEEFHFQIKVPIGGTNITLAEGLNLGAVKQTVDSDPEDVTILVAGEMNEPETGWQDFTLKAGESLVITGIPAGMVYYVRETDAGTLGYTTKIKVEQDGATMTDADQKDREKYTLTSVKTDQRTTSRQGDTVYFLNIKDAPTNTGIVLDIIPYAVVVLAVAGCAVLFFFKKKRMAR